MNQNATKTICKHVIVEVRLKVRAETAGAAFVQAALGMRIDVSGIEGREGPHSVRPGPEA